jgi:hypothetical protein
MPKPFRNRALSFRQPYAEAILRGKKTIEYRTFPTNVRGLVYIYASMTLEPPAEYKRHRINSEQAPRGVIVGIVEIMDCQGEDGSYEWLLANAKRLPKPIKPKRQPMPSFFYAW